MKRTTQFFAVLFIFFFGVGSSAKAAPFYTIEGDGIKINADDTLYISSVTDNMDVTKENLGVVVGNEIVFRSNGDGIGGALFNTTPSITGDIIDVVWNASAGNKVHLWHNQFYPDGSGAGLRHFLFGSQWDAIAQDDHSVLSHFYDAVGNLKYSFRITDSPYSSTPVSIGGIIPLVLIGLMGMFTFHRRFSDPGGTKMAMT